LRTRMMASVRWMLAVRAEFDDMPEVSPDA